MVHYLNKREIGKLFEEKACSYLKEQGLLLITKNYYTPFGEIDLIMQDKNEIVFIEVRLRTSSLYGSAVETIHYAKQKKVIKSAIHYLKQKKYIDTKNCRFDVVGFSKNHIEWIRDAFSYE